METSAKKLVHRIQCMLGQVVGGGFLRGNITEGEVVKMNSGARHLTAIHKHLILHDSGSMNESTLMATMRRDHQAGARLFVVDYLQLLQSRGETDTERATSASKCLKHMACELDCPVITISSLSRQNASQKPRKPVMSDLRQSGQIEFDADKVWLLWCGDVTAEVREVELGVAKSKDGELGDVNLTFFAGEFRMESASRVFDSDVPKD